MKSSTPYRVEDEFEEESTPSACFCFPCPLHSRQRGGLEYRSLLPGDGDDYWEERGGGAKELLAKWGALLQRLRERGGCRKRRPQCQYDPVSYALNFDEGPRRGEAAGRASLGVSGGLPTKGSYI